MFNKVQAQFLLNLVLNSPIKLTLAQVASGVAIDEDTKDIIAKLTEIVNQAEESAKEEQPEEAQE